MDLYRRWSSEIGPDLWGFLCCGPAQSRTISEILALPPDYAFRISMSEPHPPAYVRALLSFDWCRHQWGEGPWSGWRQTWIETYPLDLAPPQARGYIEAAVAAIPVVTHTLLKTRFRGLGGRALPNLFDPRRLEPKSLQSSAQALIDRNCPAEGDRPCHVLAQFRTAADRGLAPLPTINRLMGSWLNGLAVKGPHAMRASAPDERMTVS